jgi:hypothetical protein
LKRRAKFIPTLCVEILILVKLNPAPCSHDKSRVRSAEIVPGEYGDLAEILEVETSWNAIIWQQFGASIDMLENAVQACPEEVWSDRSQPPEFWYVAYHTLFWLDLYLSDSPEGFAPPPPFTLDELDPAGLVPERPYAKQELLAYLEHGRAKCRAAIVALTDEQLGQRCGVARFDFSIAELMLYNMRHVQHHTAQLNLMLRQRIDSAPRWVRQAQSKL